MDTPHVLVVEEVVDSLLFETDLMGNLIRRYSSIDNVDGPVMFRGKIIDDLDDTVKLDLTPVDEPSKTRKDDDRGNCCLIADLDDTVKLNLTPDDDEPSKPREDDNQDNKGLDAADDVLHKSALIDQPNGDLMLGKNLDLPPNLSGTTANDDDQDESKTDDEEYAEFDPMDYLCFYKSTPTGNSNNISISEEMDEEQDDDQFYEASANFDLDLLPVESGTAGQDVPNECTSGGQNTITFDGTANGLSNDSFTANNSNHQIVYENNDDGSDQEMRLELSSDQVENVQDNGQTSGFDSEKCNNDKCIVEMAIIPENIALDPAHELSHDLAPSNDSSHQIVCENNDDGSDQEMRLELSSDQVKNVQDNGQTSGFDSEKCNNDKCIVEMAIIPENIALDPAHELSHDLAPSNDSSHQIVCEQESDDNESDQEMRLDLSSDELEGVKDDGSSRDLNDEKCKNEKRRIVDPESTSEKLENDTTPPVLPDLNQDKESIVEKDNVSSGLDDETCQKDEARKNQDKKSKKKLQTTPIKGKYNTRKNKRKKIIVSPDLGSEISSTSSSSDEESSSWSGTTSIDSDKETDCSSDSFSEEPFICTRYNLRHR